jgi:hypothetical protein
MITVENVGLFILCIALLFIMADVSENNRW